MFGELCIWTEVKIRGCPEDEVMDMRKSPLSLLELGPCTHTTSSPGAGMPQSPGPPETAPWRVAELKQPPSADSRLSAARRRWRLAHVTTDLACPEHWTDAPSCGPGRALGFRLAHRLKAAWP